MSKNEQEEDGISGKAKKANKDEFFATIEDLDDPVLLVLRTHLFFEYLLERVICAELPRGDILIEHGSLSFSQKLTLVRALDCVGDELTTVLRHLNKIRNQCSHERDKKITQADVDLIGRPLGKAFTKYRNQHAGQMLNILKLVLARTAGGLVSSLEKLEIVSTVKKSPAGKS